MPIGIEQWAGNKERQKQLGTFFMQHCASCQDTVVDMVGALESAILTLLLNNTHSIEEAEAHLEAIVGDVKDGLKVQWEQRACSGRTQ